MRIRLLRNVRMTGASSVELLAGTVVKTTNEVAEKWLKQGLAMEDKSIDGGIETKSVSEDNSNHSTVAADIAYKTTEGEVTVERKTRNKRKNRIKRK